jgi:hypothetical protein
MSEKSLWLSFFNNLSFSVFLWNYNICDPIVWFPRKKGHTIFVSEQIMALLLTGQPVTY